MNILFPKRSTLAWGAALVGAFLTSLTSARADVTWRVSVKFIDDSSGNRPTVGTITNNAAVQEHIDFANTLPTFIGRGVTLDLTEILDVTGESKWFGRDPGVKSNRVELEAEAKANSTKYHWRSDAINIYLNNQSGGGGSFPGEGDIIFLGTGNQPWVFIHEIGHIMSLHHTHEGESCGTTGGIACSNCPKPKPGDDGLDDTLPDHQCFTQEGLAQQSFGKSYAALSSSQQQQVNNTLYNIMSYHSQRSIFTTRQLDAMCDTSNRERDSYSHNNFLFVDPFSIGITPDGSSSLQAFTGPYPNLPDGIDAAFGGDVLLLRPGNYAESREIRKAMTLRAVRRDGLTPGDAILRAK